MDRAFHEPHDAAYAPLVTLISASGGCGKSSLALVMAHITAHAGIQTALLEGDLQFGDMGFWLGLPNEAPNLKLGRQCEPIRISSQLELYKAPVLPEIAEEISDEVANFIPTIRLNHRLVIADTGQFWSGLTGELLCSSSLIMLLMDRRESSVFGAIKALELCHRLGIPSARIICITNRFTPKAKSELVRIRAALNVEEVFCMQDGKSSVEALVGTGRIDEFVESGTPPTDDIEALLEDVLPRVGLNFQKPNHKKARRLFA